MKVFGLIVQAIAMMSLLIDVNGELTADAVFSLLSGRLDNLAFDMYNLKSELRDSLAIMNKRIDDIERFSESQFHQHGAEVRRQKNMESDVKTFKQTKENIHKALAMEKMFIRNVITDYDEKFRKFQAAVGDQMNLMNTIVKTSNERLERELNEQAGNINQLKTNFQQDIADQETMIANVSNNHDITVSKLEGLCTTVNNIENDLKGQGDKLRTVNSSITEIGRRLTRGLDSVRGRLSPLEDEMRVSFSYHGFQYQKVRGKEEVITFYTLNGHVYGDGYDYNKGVFTTHKSGIYLIHCSVQFVPTDTVIALYVGGKKVGEVDKDLVHTAYLSAGQEIYVTQHSNFPFRFYEITFNVILIN